MTESTQLLFGLYNGRAMFRTTYDEEAKIWSGPQSPQLFHPKVNVAQVLFDALARNPNQIGQISNNNGLYVMNRALRLNAIRMAQHMQELGICSGDVVAIVAGNHHEVAAVVFGAMALAAPINTLDPNFKAAEIAHMLALTMPKTIFCETWNISFVREALLGLGLTVPIFTFGAKVDGARLVDVLLRKTGTEEEFLTTPLDDGNQTACIVCSSGTTGDSKGVRLSHATLLTQLNKAFELTSEDVLLTFSSLYWISGFAALISTTLRGATRVITTQSFNAELMLEVVERYKVTVTMMAPSHVSTLLQSPDIHIADLSSLRRFYATGSVVSEELCKRINQFLPSELLVVYGMSEVAGMLASNVIPTRSGSVGLLISGMRMRVLDDENGLCGPNEDGEISIWIDPPFQGYWNNEEATAAMIDDDGWLRSGDVGHFDDDGYLYLVDRKKDMMKYRNYQISPSELEGVVLGARGVAAVCVVGVPDGESNDLATALVVRSKDEEIVTEEEIYDLVRDKLSDSKLLRGGIFFVDELPKTHSGKMLRRKVKQIAIELYNERRLMGPQC